jgi:hypothetical protein
MPRRTDISSILITGAGPIVIGRAAELENSRPRNSYVSVREVRGHAGMIPIPPDAIDPSHNQDEASHVQTF